MRRSRVGGLLHARPGPLGWAKSADGGPGWTARRRKLPHQHQPRHPTGSELPRRQARGRGSTGPYPRAQDLSAPTLHLPAARRRVVGLSLSDSDAATTCARRRPGVAGQVRALPSALIAGLSSRSRRAIRFRSVRPPIRTCPSTSRESSVSLMTSLAVAPCLRGSPQGAALGRLHHERRSEREGVRS